MALPITVGHVAAAGTGDDYPSKLRLPVKLDSVLDDWQFWNRECTSCGDAMKSDASRMTDDAFARCRRARPAPPVRTAASQPAVVVLTTDSPLPDGNWVLTMYWGDGASDSQAFTGPGTPVVTFSHSFGRTGWVSGSNVYMSWGMLGEVGKQVPVRPPAQEVLYPMAVPAMAVDQHVC